MKINEFKEGLELKGQPLFIKDYTSGVASNGKEYLNVFLSDNTSNIEGKFWGVDEKIKSTIKKGQVMLVDGSCLSYKNILQLKIINLSVVDQETINIEDFIISSSIPKDELKSSIDKAVALIENHILKDIVTNMLRKYENDFYQYPAACKIHHDFISGLALHVNGMLSLGLNMAKIYPNINKDLLISGIILHDIGKITEFSDPVATEYTTEGKLIGHISLMQSDISQMALYLGYSLDQEEVILLRHMILSHHGHLEFGSPVLPLIREAELLFFIDNIDSRMNILDKA
ncbi:MAG: HD domain-containing protein, partial [Erysipelotrichaceae bacterium]